MCANIVHSLSMCVCVVIPFILDVRLVNVPSGVTQEVGHTGFISKYSKLWKVLKACSCCCNPFEFTVLSLVTDKENKDDRSAHYPSQPRNEGK